MSQDVPDIDDRDLYALFERFAEAEREFRESQQKRTGDLEITHDQPPPDGS